MKLTLLHKDREVAFGSVSWSRVDNEYDNGFRQAAERFHGVLSPTAMSVSFASEWEGVLFVAWFEQFNNGFRYYKLALVQEA